MRKTVWLYAFLFLFIQGCDNTPTSSDPPTSNPPQTQDVQIVAFTALPAIVARDDMVELEWEVKYADKVVIQPNIGEVQADSWRFVYPQDTITYTLTATNSRGSKSSSKTVTVKYAILKVKGKIGEGTKSYGSPYFYGKVTNTGNNTAWNAGITIYCWGNTAQTKLLDEAWDYLKDGKNIRPGDVVNFEAIAFDCNNHSEIKAITIEFDWLERSIGSATITPQQYKSVFYKEQRKREIEIRELQRR